MTLGYFVTKEQVKAHYTKIIEEIYRHCQGRQVVLVRNTPDFKKRRWKVESQEHLLKAIERSLERNLVDHYMTMLPALHATIERQTAEDGISHDLVVDIDAKQSHVICKEATSHAISFLEDKEIPIALKFSGGVGYHLIIPGETFPRTIDGHSMSEIFPRVGEAFQRRIISILLEKMGKTLEKGIKVDMTMSRPDHLLRAPYSIHEKTGLVSTPLTIEGYQSFQPKDAMLGKDWMEESWWPNAKNDENVKALCVELEWWRYSGVKKPNMRTFVFPRNRPDLQRLRKAFVLDMKSGIEARKNMLEKLKKGFLREKKGIFGGQEEHLKVEKGVVKELFLELSSNKGSLIFQPMNWHEKLALELVLSGRTSRGSVLSERWVGDFAKKVEGLLSMEGVTVYAYYSRGVRYNIDFSTKTGNVVLRICHSHPIQKAIVSTITGNITITWNQSRGEPYGNWKEGKIDLRTQTGSISIEEPPESVGVIVELPHLDKRNVNTANWTTKSRNGVSVAESIGFEDSISRYFIQILGSIPKVKLE